jgi:VWFA-related protein
MPLFPFARRVFCFLTTALLFSFCAVLRAQNSSALDPAPAASSASASAPPAQDESAKQDAAKATNAQQSSENSELVSQDGPATFKVRVNLVLVRVVVRDEKGKVVTNLRREDFQLFDNRKPQAITYFSVETPESQALKPAPSAVADNDETGATPKDLDTAAKNLPQRFVAVMFDDVHMSMQDTSVVRDAATRLFGALAPSDRVAMFSASGQFQLKFTADRELLAKSLYSLVPHPTAGGTGFHDCPDVSYYQADLIQNKNDSQALSLAAEDAVQCAFNGDESKISQAIAMAQSAAARSLALGDQETEYAYRHIEDAMGQLSGMPGQRVMVFVSPGFIPSTLWSETSALIDRATHAGIVVNTIDARGLYTPDLSGDIADPPRDSARTGGFKVSYRLQAQTAQDQVLEQLAYGTGGTFFHNRNDLDEGLRQAVAAPSLSYLLGFSPQNLKVDGRFHGLKVSLTSKQKYAIQARNGYYAPKTIPNPVEAAKQEIREAIFSQEELHDMPVDVQTQFFKKDATSARLSVLTHFDIKGIHFRKIEGRNADVLTIATAIFDDNGNLVTGGEKTVQMKLLDTTYNRLSRSGLTLKSSYDVKPGSYMVRLVVRDGEGSQMAARNGAVVIPN